jgi:hypothetical protein
MKLSLVGPAAFIFVAISLVIGCNNSENKVEEAKSVVLEAKVDLNNTDEEYLTDIESYKIGTAEKTAENDRKIAEFKTQIRSNKKELKDKYQMEIDKLENENNVMKKKMDSYQARVI